MDAAWIGTISAIGGAAVAGTLALLNDRLGNRREDARAEAQRLHEISERRFDARRDAYVAFGAACHRAINSTLLYEYEHEGEVPGLHGHEGPISYLIEAMDLIRIIGPDDAAAAASDAVEKISDWTFASGKSTYRDASDAVDEFARITRRLLKLDVQ